MKRYHDRPTRRNHRPPHSYQDTAALSALGQPRMIGTPEPFQTTDRRVNWGLALISVILLIGGLI